MPGTLARTFPWELDPARLPGTGRTHAVVTVRRLLVIDSGAYLTSTDAEQPIHQLSALSADSTPSGIISQ